MERQMYGSTHTHFEDLFDTGNDKEAMVLLFHSLGAKRVALTGHGSMFAYEDLKEITKRLKDTKEISEDFEVVPGVEVYFEEEAKHMVLVAKDYDGYKQLCRVITDSARNSKTSKNTMEDVEYLTPIVTLENLQKNISGGHVYMTTACAGGIFARSLGSDEISIYRKKVGKKEDALNAAAETYESDLYLVEEWNRKTKDPANRKLTKKETDKLEKAKEEGDEEVVQSLEAKAKRAEELDQYKQNNKKEVELAKKRLKSYETASVNFQAAMNELDDYRQSEPYRFEKAKELYRKLEGVFGKENIYFELQNHGLLQEKIAYNNTVKLAYEVGNPNFIASNDVHIGDRKGSDTWEASVTRRRVEMFNRFKSIYNSPDEEEYGVKTDAELKEELLKILAPYTDEHGTLHSPEEIADAAIGNIEKALGQCHVEFPEISLDGVNFYPKFCENEAEMFGREVEAGIADRFPNGLPEGYRERIEYETSVIESMGFCGYHLIVKDYVEYGRLLGYLRTEEEIANAPLSIEELNKYIDDNHIPRVGMGVGPGRGSAAGCLCAYLLGITDVDPIQYGLMFERFLNPSRRSMPDIDSDFKDDIRERLYQYIEARYGEANVSKVCTKAEAHGKAAAGIASRYLSTLEGEGKTKAEQAEIKEKYGAALKRVSGLITKYMKENDLSAVKVENGTKAARALYKERKEEKQNDLDQLEKEKVSLDELRSKMTKVPEDAIMKENEERVEMLVQKIDGMERTYKSSYNEDWEREQNILEMIDIIAGIPSNISMHACACLISGTPLSDVIPLAWNDAKQKMTTQCLYPQAEELGLLKMDLLNIKNLSVITRVMQDCLEKEKNGEWKFLTEHNSPGKRYDGDLLRTRKGIQDMLCDEKIFEEIFCKGRTGGVFQFESDGITKMVRDFEPSCFDDIIILVSAYRPGPIDFIPEMIAEKWWRKLGDKSPYGKPVHKINIKNEKLTAILDPTYGVPIYQEQIMKIVQELAGYNMADADNVRKYMSKKKTALLEKERGFFVYGSKFVIKEATEKMNALRNKENPTEEDLKEANKLEAEIKKMPTYINGCVPNRICTAEEANLLFDAMIEFGKYAFNKSHAMCYAEVAMMTAYQKLYFPELFYKYTLSNETKDGPNPKDKRMASEKYMGEMASFRLKMLPPDPSKSKSDWELEKESCGIRMGFGCIKGCHYEDYNFADNIFDFIKNNPDISISQMQVFVKLGMFDMVYPSKDKEAERERVNGNRRYMEEWVKENGEDVKAFGKMLAETRPERLSIHKKLENRGDSLLCDVEELEARYEEISRPLREMQAHFQSLKDNDNKKYPEETNAEKIADRAYEYEKMGVVFSAEKDLEKLRGYDGGTNFKVIEDTRDTTDKWGDTVKVAATVVGKTEMPAGRGPRWKINLMDRNGKTMQFGSFEKVDPVADITCGVFDVSYGMYLSLKKVKPLNEAISEVEVNKANFKEDIPVQSRKHPVSGEIIKFQEIQRYKVEEPSESELEEYAAMESGSDRDDV